MYLQKIPYDMFIIMFTTMANLIYILLAFSLLDMILKWGWRGGGGGGGIGLGGWVYT